MLTVADVDPMNEMRLATRDGTVHVIRWSRGTPPFTLCRTWTLGDDPTDDAIRRGLALVPTCIGCIGRLEEG